MTNATTFRAGIILILCVFLAGGSFAQDTIIKLTNTRLVVKVIEITPKEVKYKKIENPGGPLFVLDRKQVARIIYANGTTDTFSLKSAESIAELALKDPRVIDFKKNHITLVVSDIFYGKLSVGYERILNSGRFSLKIPFSMGFRYLDMKDSVNQDGGDYWNETWSTAGYYGKYKIFSTGIECYYYTGGQGTLRYFIGPSIEYGQFNYWLYHQLPQNPYYGYYTKDRGSYTAFLVKNGLVFQPSKNFNISFNAGAGFFSANTDYYDDYQPGPLELVEDGIAFEFGLNVGYKF